MFPWQFIIMCNNNFIIIYNSAHLSPSPSSPSLSLSPLSSYPSPPLHPRPSPSSSSLFRGSLRIYHDHAFRHMDTPHSLSTSCGISLIPKFLRALCDYLQQCLSPEGEDARHGLRLRVQKTRLLEECIANPPASVLPCIFFCCFAVKIYLYYLFSSFCKFLIKLIT